MACQGLECGNFKEIWSFFLGKVPLRLFFMFPPDFEPSELAGKSPDLPNVTMRTCHSGKRRRIMTVR